MRITAAITGHAEARPIAASCIVISWAAKASSMSVLIKERSRRPSFRANPPPSVHLDNDPDWPNQVGNDHTSPERKPKFRA